MKIKLKFAWYNFWVGFFIDVHNRSFYFVPIPMVGIMFQFKKKEFKPKWKLYEIKDLKKLKRKKYKEEDFRDSILKHTDLSNKVVGVGNHDMILVNKISKEYMTFCSESPFGIQYLSKAIIKYKI